jgi:hypothetical protein
VFGVQPIAAWSTLFSVRAVFFLACSCPCLDDESDLGWGEGREVGGVAVVEMGKKVVAEQR